MNKTSNFQTCCGQKTLCINSRPHGNMTRRRYRCRVCNKRWTTVERVLSEPAKGDTRKAFDAQAFLRAQRALA